MKGETENEKNKAQRGRNLGTNTWQAKPVCVCAKPVCVCVCVCVCVSVCLSV